MQFPTSYDDIKTFEEHNKVCVMVYTTSTENILKKKKKNKI